MTAFVTDGDERSSLAVVRALGRAGIPVTVGNSRPASLAGSSRFCARRVCYPSPLEHAELFQSFLLQEMQSGRYRVLIPMTDVTLRLVSQIHATLTRHVQVPIPSGGKIDLAHDKLRVFRLAEQLRIPCPETFVAEEGESLDSLARQIHYPVVIKPRFSRFYSGGTWVTGSVRYANDPNELKDKYARCHLQIPFPLVQEKIEGEGQGVFLLLWDGELKAAFFHRRLREKPPWGGVSVYRESIPWHEDLLRRSLLLLEKIGWQGVAMVEFKLDRRDGQAKLMEVNGRFWGSLQLAIDAGLDFPLLLYRLATGENVPAQLNYKVGVKSRWLLGDLDHLLVRLSRPQGGDGLLVSKVSRLRACLDFLKFYEPNLHYEVMRLDDPRPGWFECKSYVRDILGRLVRPTGRAHAH